jgi:hypothetical protein
MTGAAVGTLVALVGPRLKRISGLIERLFYVSSIAWFFIISIELPHIAGNDGASPGNDARRQVMTRIAR